MDLFDMGESIIEDNDVLIPDNGAYRPTELPERQEELQEIALALRPIQTGSTPHNAMIYGPTGQGKTLALEIQTDKVRQWAALEEKDVIVVNVRCKGCDSSYHVLARLVKTLREVRKGPGEEKPRGYTRKELVDIVFDEFEKLGGTIIIVLDEIDGIGEDDYALYELSRPSVENAKIGLIGVTNDAQFRQNLDADVQSSLGNREIYFNPYDATQLRNILARRVVAALKDTAFTDESESFENLESDVLEDGVIPKVAALASQETGDARQGIRLLQQAVELAEKTDGVVTEDHVEQAHERLEQQAVKQLVSGETTQRKIALACVIKESLVGNPNAETAELYQVYRTFCEQFDVRELSQQTFRYKLNDLTHSNVLSKTRRGRGQGKGMTNHYSLSIDRELALEGIGDDPLTSEIKDILDGIDQG